MEVNQLTGIILDASIKIHNEIGPGCFEKVYEEALYMRSVSEICMQKDN